VEIADGDLQMTRNEQLRNELLVRYDNQGAHLKEIKCRLKIAGWKLAIGSAYLIKRILDISCAILGIIVLSPVFIGTAIMIMIEDGRPVIFKQKRVGKDGVEFDFFKFRSMVKDAEKLKDQLLGDNESGDGVIFKMKDDPRILKVGKFIRKYSIDELPQMFNVIRGDMSLVGPRPPVPREVAQYTLEDRKRLHVTPGITCIWQVSGRSEIPFNEQVQLDKEYIHSQSFWNDIKLLFKTIPAVLLGNGSY